MHLNASPQSDFRAAEIISQNMDAASQGSRASFRASEIAAQNAAKPMPRLLVAGIGLTLLYFMLKGKR